MDLKKLNIASPSNEGSRKDKINFPHQNLPLSRSKSLYPSTKTPKLYVKVNWKNFDKFKHFYVFTSNKNIFERFEVTLKIFSSEKSESLLVNGVNEHYNVFKFEPNKYWLTNRIKIEVKPLMRKIPENPLKIIKLSEIGEESSVSGSERISSSELPTLLGEFEYDYGIRVLFNYDESFKNPRFVITDNLPLEGLFPIVNLKFYIEIPNNYKFVKLSCQKAKQYKDWFKADLNDDEKILGEKDGVKETLLKYKGHVCPEDNYEFLFIKTTDKFTMFESINVLCNEILNKENHVYKVVGSENDKKELIFNCFDVEGMRHMNFYVKSEYMNPKSPISI